MICRRAEPLFACSAPRIVHRAAPVASPSLFGTAYRQVARRRAGDHPASARRDSTPIVGGNQTPFSDLDRR
jgi:hypothetical protein